MEHLLNKSTSSVMTHIAESTPDITTFYATGYYMEGMYGRDPFIGKPQPLSRSDLLKPTWVRTARQLIAAQLTTHGSKILPPDHVSICSKVVVNDQERHLPMLDYERSDWQKTKQEQLEDLVLILDQLRFPGGVIINSGRGFHFIGFEPFTTERYNEALAYAIDIQQAKEKNAIYYGLDARFWRDIFQNKGVSPLRVTSGYGKPTRPRVIKIYSPN